MTETMWHLYEQAKKTQQRNSSKEHKKERTLDVFKGSDRIIEKYREASRQHTRSKTSRTELVVWPPGKQGEDVEASSWR